MTNASEKAILIDKPAKVDLFNLEKYHTAFKTIIEKCDTPMTISIQGDLGTGKTSFVNQVFDMLDGNKITTVTFNTWKYSQFNIHDDLVVVFLNEFINKVVGASDEGKKLKEICSKIFNMVKTIPVMKDFKEIKIGEFVQKILENSQDEQNVVEEITNFQDRLQKFVDKKERVVIFIDDLDRVAPLKVINLLEVFQNFLTLKNCVFILAVDYEVVVQGFKEKMGDSYTILKSKNFFDKIIQLPFSLPTLNEEDAIDFLKELMTAVTGKKTDYKKFATIISASIQFNPRKLKRLMNSYWLLSLVNADKNDEQYSFALFYILCMQLEYEHLYRLFTQNYNNYPYIQEIINNVENNENSEALNTIIKKMEEESENDNESIKKELYLFLGHFSNTFSSENQENIEEVFQEIMSLTKTTSDNREKEGLKGSMGAFVKTSIPSLKLSKKRYEELCTREYTRKTFRDSTPMFRDVTGKNDEEIYNEQRFYVLENKTKYPRYYKDGIDINLTNGETKQILLSSQWGDHQYDLYTSWLKENS